MSEPRREWFNRFSACKGVHITASIKLQPFTQAPPAAAHDEQGIVHHHPRTYTEQDNGERDKG